MTRKLSSFRVLLGAGVCLLPLSAYAQSDDSSFDVDDKPAAAAATPELQNWIDIGTQYSSGRSYYLNRFNGAVDPGFNAVAGVHFQSKDAWDSGQTQYFTFDGQNLGLPDRSVIAKVGEQGKWGVSLTYDGIPYYATNSFQSIFDMSNGLGIPRTNTISGLPGVATAFGASSQTVTPTIPTSGTLTPVWTIAPAAGANMRNYDLSLQRDIFTLGGKYQWGDWLITSGWRHEHKEGWQANSLEFVTAPSVVSASNTKPAVSANAMAYFAQPINYDMDRFDVGGAYSTEKVQVQLGYTYSQFQNNDNPLEMENPFSTSLSKSTGALYSVPPDNSAHQVKLMVGYNLSPTTRVNANFGYGLEVQNATFVSGSGSTILPQQSATLITPSFQGLIQTTFANVALVTQPMPRLNIRVAYTLDDRDNMSPRNFYTDINPDSTSTVTLTSPEHPAYNLPFSIHHQTGVVEAGYRIAPETKLTLTQTLDDVWRNYSDTSNVVTENTALKLRGPIPVSDGIFGSLGYAHEQRWASSYNPEGWWNASCGGIAGCGQTELASLVMYSEASRTHDDVKTTIDVQALQDVTFSVMGKFSKDSYPASAKGMRSNYNAEVSPDVSWQATKSLTAHAFYTYQQIYYNQASQYSTGTVGTGGTGALVPYNAQTTDSVQTFGVNVDWQAIPDLLKISLDGNLAYGDTAYALGDGMAVYGTAIVSGTTMAALNFQPLPDVKSTLITVNLHGEYKLRPNMSVLFGYEWEKFNYKDFMVGTPSTTYSNALLPGTLAPNASIQMAFAALRVKF